LRNGWKALLAAVGKTMEMCGMWQHVQHYLWNYLCAAQEVVAAYSVKRTNVGKFRGWASGA
jgi:hypothetical protein